MSETNLKKVVVLPGDGIGPEVTMPALRILEAVSAFADIGLSVRHSAIGGAALDLFGVPLPDETLKMCLTAAVQAL